MLLAKFEGIIILKLHFQKQGLTKSSINQLTKQKVVLESNFPLKYMYTLSNIAISQIYFPQIIYALQMEILNDIPIFKIYHTQLLQKTLNSFNQSDSTFQAQEINSEIIIETILANVVKNYQQESFKDAHIIQYISKLSFNLQQQYLKSRIFDLLIKITNPMDCDRYESQTQNQDKNMLICLKYIEIFVNQKMVKPSLIKYLGIQRNYSNLYYFKICRYNQLIEFLELGDLNLNQTKLKNLTQNQLRIEFPELATVQFQQSKIVQMLQLIYYKKDLIKEQLSEIFKQLNVIQLLNDISMYNLQESAGFIIINKLNNYISNQEITSQVFMKNSLLKMTEIDRSKALSTLRLLLRMMVEQDVVIPELIQFIKVNINKFSVYQFKMIQSRNMLSFVENDVRIMSLLQNYNIKVQRSGKQLINYDKKQIKLQNKYYEFQCIMNRMEAIDKQKYQFKTQLIQIFQLDSVKKLFTKLNQLRVEFTVEQQPYVYKGYKILINIMRFLEEHDE